MTETQPLGFYIALILNKLRIQAQVSELNEKLAEDIDRGDDDDRSGDSKDREDPGAKLALIDDERI